MILGSLRPLASPPTWPDHDSGSCLQLTVRLVCSSDDLSECSVHPKYRVHCISFERFSNSVGILGNHSENMLFIYSRLSRNLQSAQRFFAPLEYSSIYIYIPYRFGYRQTSLSFLHTETSRFIMSQVSLDSPFFAECRPPER